MFQWTRTRGRLALIALPLLVAACKQHTSQPPGSASGTARAAAAAAGSARGSTAATGAAAAKALPALRLDRLHGEVMARGINVLAAKLYRGAPTDRNVVRSPLGEAVQLALLDLGPHTALTRTSRMALDLRRGEGQPVLGALLARLTARGRHADGALSLHSALWLVDKGRLRAGYAPEARYFYQTDVHAGVPSTDGAVRAQVKGWLTRHGRQRFSTVLAPGSKRPTQLVLATVVDLAASWPTPLPQAAARFTLGSGKRVSVPTVTRRCDGTLQYARYDGLDVVALPYRRVGSARLALELMLLVPDPIEGKPPAAALAALQRRVDALNLRRWGALVRAHPLDAARLSKTRRRVGPTLGARLRRIKSVHRKRPLCVDVSWPGFSLATASARTLSTRNGTVVSAARLGSSALGTTAVPQRAVKALAARAADDVAAREKRAKQPDAVEVDVLAVHVDRPFVFVVRERQSGLIVLIGHVVDPRARSGR